MKRLNGWSSADDDDTDSPIFLADFLRQPYGNTPRKFDGVKIFNSDFISSNALCNSDQFNASQHAKKALLMVLRDVHPDMIT